MKKKKFWCKYFTVFCTFKCHFWSFPQIERHFSQCLWTFACIYWLIFQIWNAQVEIVFNMGDFPSSNMDLLSRKKIVVRAQVPTSACQESRFGVNPYGKRVFQGGSLVYVLCPMVAWRLWERCQRARLCGGGERRTEYDRQLLQWPKHQELGGETQEGQTVVLKVQSTNKMFLCPKSKHFLAGKKLRFPVHLWNPMRKNLIPLFETGFVYQKDTITTPTSQSFHFLFLKLMQGPHYVHDESQSS